jgi:transcriptional regulator with XRE-family HTH domain
MTIIERLKAKLSATGISVLKFAKESGIDSPKVYKWLDKKSNASPKFEDVQKIEAWLKKLEKPDDRDKLAIAGMQVNLNEIYVIQAQLTALRNELAKLMARDQKRPLSDCLDEIEQNADVILRSMLRGKE